MELAQFNGQNIEELSMIEVAYAILETKGDVIDFTELLLMIQDYLSLSEEMLEKRMVRFYTDINIDGRFISLGDNRWGLRAWYPINSIDEETITSSEDEETTERRRKKRKVNAFGDDDMIDYNDDDPEDSEDYEDEDYDYEDDEDDDVIEIDDVDVEDDDDLDGYVEDLSILDDEDLELDDAEFEDEDDESLEDADEEFEE